MKTLTRVSYLERLFTRSCLETSVAIDRMPRLMPTTGKSLRDRTHTQLHQLKRQLLRDALEATPQAHLFKRLCGAANQAADQAWETNAPLLVFPCLFEELITAARAQHDTAPLEIATIAFPFPRPAFETALA
ncbi:MAG: hypothetical protein QM813_12580 [Verrucomicrobiota bacterium]